MKRANRAPIYHGWVMLTALSITEPVSWGVLYYAITVFFKPMEADLGWSRSQMTGAFSISLLIAGLAGVPVGRLLDRHGPRWIMTAGSISATLLVLAWSRVHSLTHFYLIWAALGLVSATVLYEPAFVAVANWFARHRSRALTILTFGGGLASVIFIPLASWLVSAYGWRTALAVLAVILGAVTIPLHALTLRRRPADLGLEIDGETAPDPRAIGAPGESAWGSLPRRRASFVVLVDVDWLVLNSAGERRDHDSHHSLVDGAGIQRAFRGIGGRVDRIDGAARPSLFHAARAARSIAGSWRR